VKGIDNMPSHQVAVDLFDQGYACSQAVLTAFAERFGLNRELALKVSSAFGGGIARRAETCGAVTGALMVIGLKTGSTTAKDIRAKDVTYNLSKEFFTRFTARNNTLACKGLLGVDISTPEGHKAAKDRKLFKTECPKYVQDAAEILDEIL